MKFLNIHSFAIACVSLSMIVSSSANPPPELNHQVSEEIDRKLKTLVTAALHESWGNPGPADGTRIQINPIRTEISVDGFSGDKDCFLVTLKNFNNEVRAVAIVSSSLKSIKILHSSNFNVEKLETGVTLENLRAMAPQERLDRITALEKLELQRKTLNSSKLEGLKNLKLDTLDELINLRKQILSPVE